MLFDLASLTKPLVTAPLALEHLDLDRDWGPELGFRDWPGPVTPRRLLSHSAGLPPWLPYTGVPLSEQMSEQMVGLGAWGRHALLREAKWGESTYSDLGYRLLAEILEMELGQDWRALGENLTGLAGAPWGESPAGDTRCESPAGDTRRETPVQMPPGADHDAWPLATTAPFPAPQEGMPHDANARAGMKGHAGFGATPESARRWLGAWVKKFPPLMAVETCRSADGETWGLGLQRLKKGPGGFAELLDAKGIRGANVIAYDGYDEPPQVGPRVPAGPSDGSLDGSSDWWFHLGYTGPALFVRPGDGACVLLLCHRLAGSLGLLPVGALMARRWQMLNDFKGTVA
jgi:CubicO group peptidase (beta-lactamase class C family)